MDTLFFVICFFLFTYAVTEDTCPMPAIPDNAKLLGVNQSTFPVGYIAKIIGGCSPGTYFNQTCLSNATWTKPTLCKEMAWCDRPDVNVHTSIVNPREEYYFNTSITIACDNGYIHGGPDTIYCQSNGSWEAAMPECIKNECPENCMPGQICNDTDHACPYGKCESSYWGRFCQHPRECRTTSKGKEYKGHKNVSISGQPCQMWKLDIPHDHKFKDLPENYCRNPDGEPEPWCYTTNEDIRWEICGIPLCYNQCPPPPLSVNTDVINIPENGFPVGYKVKISGTRCGTGNVGSKVCEVNKYRRWSAAQCIPVECEMPTLHNHSYIISKKNTYVYGDIIKVACYPGYSLDVDRVYLCQENSTWNGTMPSCHDVKCTRPILKPHMVADIPVNSSFVFGQSINISCEEGFSLTARDVITCQSDGEWENLPECKTVNCSKSDIHGKYTYIDKEKTVYKVNDTVIFSCPEGHTLEGNRGLICLASGFWNGTAPSCKVIECPLPVLFNHTDVSNPETLKDRYIYGEALSLVCDIGYEIRGTNTISCNDRKSWGKIPKCTAISCAVPTLSSHHVIQVQGNHSLTVNGTLNIDCVSGYSPVGGVHSLKCLENGTWKGRVPKCEEVKCSYPLLQNTNVKATKSQYNFMDVISVTCQEGFIPTETHSYECQRNGLWNGTMPICTRVWCSNPVLNPLTFLELPVVKKEKYEYKSEIKIACIPGYTLYGRNVFRCQKTGYWNGTMPKCLAANCEIPKISENATIFIQDKQDLMPGGSIQIGCKEGFIARGTSLLRCLPNSTWSGPVPICEVTTCKNPTLNADNLLVTPNKDVFEYNQQIVVSCMTGFRVQGQTIFRCEHNGVWNGTMPFCNAIKCTAPTLRDNSFFANPKVDHYLYGDLIQVLCPPNFLLIGQALLRCQNNGVWNSTMPFCKAILCPVPSISKEKYVVISDKRDLEVGGSIFIKCADGLSPFGDNMLTCLQNGTWDKKVPSCDVVKCEPPNQEKNSFIRNLKEQYTYGDVIHIQCKEESILQGQSTLMCTKHGTWNGSMPSCIDVTCTLPSLSQDSVMIGGNLSSLSSGTEIKIGCRTGYLPVSLSTLRCNALGVWDGDVPRCEIVKCANPDLPKGTYIAIGRKQSYIFGDIVIVACYKTFKGTVRTMLKCDHDKVWIGNFPLCEEMTCNPPNPRNAVRITFNSTKSFHVGGIIYTQCQNDKDFGTYLQCLESGAWNDSLPLCSNINCQRPKLKNNSVIAYGEKRIYSENDEIYIRCIKGYEMENRTQMRRCLNSRVWSEDMPVCQEEKSPSSMKSSEPVVIAAVAACVTLVVAIILSAAASVLWRRIQLKKCGQTSRTYLANLQNLSKQGPEQGVDGDTPSNENTL